MAQGPTGPSPGSATDVGTTTIPEGYSEMFNIGRLHPKTCPSLYTNFDRIWGNPRFHNFTELNKSSNFFSYGCLGQVDCPAGQVTFFLQNPCLLKNCNLFSRISQLREESCGLFSLLMIDSTGEPPAKRRRRRKRRKQNSKEEDVETSDPTSAELKPNLSSCPLTLDEPLTIPSALLGMILPPTCIFSLPVTSHFLNH